MRTAWQTAQSAETSATPAEEIESVTPKTLKTDPLEPANSKAEGGAWIAAPLEKNSSPSLQQTAAPACVEELRKAAEELECQVEEAREALERCENLREEQRASCKAFLSGWKTLLWRTPTLRFARFPLSRRSRCSRSRML